MKQGIGIFIVVAIIGLVTAVIHSWNTRKTPPERKSDKRPNILFVIAGDQSSPYAALYSTTGVKTPAFDEVAGSGILKETGRYNPVYLFEGIKN